MTEPAETTVTTVSEQTAALRDGGAAYYLDPDSMSDADSLDAALDELAASGCNAVIFPVKTEGGVFHYRTELDFVATVIDGNDPIQSELSAADIVKAADADDLYQIMLQSTGRA